MHGFKQQGGRGRGGEGDVEIGVAVERRYGALYDDVTNPFKEFQGQQKDRQRKTMNVPDKVGPGLSRICQSLVAWNAQVDPAS